jgi:uridylate kinase
MKRKRSRVWVISLGGSRIVPDDVDYDFIKGFKKLLMRNKDEKFVVVCGGGKTARRYMGALRELGKGETIQSEIGIFVTRFHARFLMRIFGMIANHDLPYTLSKVKRLLLKNRVVFCGALRQNREQTTDSTSARIASYLNSSFVNITNVEGLFTKDPKKNKGARLISDISWADFNLIAQKIKYHPGQNFVLDQRAAVIIKKERITTFIVGSLSEFEKIINGKEFVGTKIEG